MTLSPRMWRVGGIAAAVLLLVGAWFALISPTMQKAAALDVETASQQAASEQLRSRISLLKKQSEELPAQEAILAEIQQRMPPTVALPTLIRNLTTVAKNANVIVASVTPAGPRRLLRRWLRCRLPPTRSPARRRGFCRTPAPMLQSPLHRKRPRCRP